MRVGTVPVGPNGTKRRGKKSSWPWRRTRVDELTDRILGRRRESLQVAEVGRVNKARGWPVGLVDSAPRRLSCNRIKNRKVYPAIGHD